MNRSYRGYSEKSCPCNQNENPILEDTCDNVTMLSDYDSNNLSCGYEEDSLFPDNPTYGNSYVPNQVLNSTFMPDVGLKLGTIFPELVRPYIPGESMAQIEFLRRTNNIKEGCNRE